MLDNPFNNLNTALSKLGEELITQYRSQLSQTGTDASGKLGNDITYYIESEGDAFELSLSLQDYWKYVEDGREPGKFPNIEAIRNWIRIKPIVPRVYNGTLPTINQLSYLIGRKIANEGIEGKHLLEKSIESIDIDAILLEAITKDLELQTSIIFKL